MEPGDQEAIALLKKDTIRNALEIWNLQYEGSRYQLHVSSIGDLPRAHVGIYSAPEAEYVSLGGAQDAAQPLLELVPHRAVLSVAPNLSGLVKERMSFTATFLGDIMVVRRGQERLRLSSAARRLSPDDAETYSEFGSSFSAPKPPLEWVRERLEREVTYGFFLDAELVSVATLAAWLPEVAVVVSVETKPEFRGRGYGTSVVSAVVREGLARSEVCGLFVRSDNRTAVDLYRRLGFRKDGEEVWFDFGTDMRP